MKGEVKVIRETVQLYQDKKVLGKGSVRDTATYIEYLLSNYQDAKNLIDYLKGIVNLQLYQDSSQVIEELNFKDTGVFNNGETTGTGDKTGEIALTYEDVYKRRNAKGREEVKRTLADLQFEIQVLERAIANLPQNYRSIIEGIYTKKVSRVELCRRLYISENTLNRKRKKAIAAIANMVSIIY